MSIKTGCTGSHYLFFLGKKKDVSVIRVEYCTVMFRGILVDDFDHLLNWQCP